MIIGDADAISETGILHKNNGSFSVFEYDESNSKLKTLKPPMQLGSNGCLGRSGIYSAEKASAVYKYELEFQELQLILLWFPEEVAIRLTEVEYDLFKQVHPSEYLRHATLDMNNFRASACQKSTNLRNTNSVSSEAETAGNSNQKVTEVARSVQDLIVRYKEVSSWIKKLIQSQPTAEKRLAIILSAIRCAITCWNIGNFNSSREIWLGLKYYQIFLIY